MILDKSMYKTICKELDKIIKSWKSERWYPLSISDQHGKSNQYLHDCNYVSIDCFLSTKEL